MTGGGLLDGPGGGGRVVGVGGGGVLAGGGGGARLTGKAWVVVVEWLMALAVEAMVAC